MNINSFIPILITILSSQVTHDIPHSEHSCVHVSDRQDVYSELERQGVSQRSGKLEQGNDRDAGKTIKLD